MLMDRIDNEYFAELGIIGTSGCEEMVKRISDYIGGWRGVLKPDYVLNTSFPRFSSGEAKAVLNKSARGKDIFIINDCFNYGVKYNMRGYEVPMSPDDHFQDLKRTISALGGKASRITVVQPMLYEGRQHGRSTRESLDCAIALNELVDLGVKNIVTFDAHDDRMRNAVPFHNFDNLMPHYQMIKAFFNTVDHASLQNLMIISPDEGAINRGMYYSSVLGAKLGMFYKKRDYSVVKQGRNPIIAHEYLGDDVTGRDVIIVDDIVSSGDSFLHISEKLKERGAGRIFGFTTFGLFCNGLEIFDKYYEQGMFDAVFTTNSIYNAPELLARPWHREVDVTKYIAYYIEALNRNKSLNLLLDPTKKINDLLSRIK